MNVFLESFGSFQFEMRVSWKVQLCAVFSYKTRAFCYPEHTLEYELKSFEPCISL